MLGVFFGSWIGWMIFFGLRKSSGVVVFGGGFIVACLTLVAGIYISKYSKQENQPDIASSAVNLNISTEGVLEKDKPLVAQAVKAFFGQCPNVATLAGDIKDAKISWGYADNTGSIQHGWRNPVELVVKFSQDPQDQRLIDWRAFGHTCYYTMGGGIDPGWNTGKEPCANICGVTANDNGEFFAEVPQMELLDDPKTQEYQQALIKAKTEWNADLSKEMANAKKGDEDSISNVGYLYGRGTLGFKGDKYNECVWRSVSYLTTRYEVSSDLIKSATQRKQMEAAYIEGKRQTAKGVCSRNLSPERALIAIEEAKKIADSIPGKRPARRPVLNNEI